MATNNHDVYLFSNLKGKREEWSPPLTLTAAEFWDRVKHAHAVFIPANYWRVLIKQDNIIHMCNGEYVMLASGNYPVGVKNGIHIYSDAFTPEPTKGFRNPIVIVDHYQSHAFEGIA